MKDFNEWYEDALNRHTGKFGVNHRAIRDEFNAIREAEQKERDRKAIRFFKIAALVLSGVIGAAVYMAVTYG